jgi:hypothetical protein
MQNDKKINGYLLVQLYKSYFDLSINEKINFKQWRNGLNINGLFLCSISSYSKTDKYTKAPKINNGLYHHIGKNHSKYSKSFFQS